jgi:hypothetical protein
MDLEAIDEHFGGSPVALEDALNAVRQAAEVASLIERLGAPAR